MFIRLSSEALKAVVHCFQRLPSSSLLVVLPVDSLDLTHELLHPRFPVQAHILNIDGNALNPKIQKTTKQENFDF